MKLTRSDLARRTGLSHTTIMRIEEGTFAHPSPRSLKAIADGLDLPVQLLLDAAGWITQSEQTAKRPHITVTYYYISPEIIEAVCGAIESIARTHDNTFDIHFHAIADRIPDNPHNRFNLSRSQPTKPVQD
nr:helix-turn-helix transcriptional regulator [Nocardia wallacei]